MARAKRRKRASAQARVATSAMLAPAVIAMRLPLMAAEAAAEGVARPETMRAVNEKAGAFADGLAAAQLSLMRSAFGFWPKVLAGRSPAAVVIEAGKAATEAALRPGHRAVAANFRRLTKPRKA